MTWLKGGLSGYAQKKIVNAIGDFRVHYDGSVRDANNVIVQFAYGGDGLSAKELIPCPGLSGPFFVNPAVMASCLNSDAELGFDDGRYDDIGEKRRLEEGEIDLIVSYIQASIPGVQSEVTKQITHNTRKALRFTLKDVELYEHHIPQFCLSIRDHYEMAKATKGYMAGLVSSCSLGEPTTQQTLNSVDYEEYVYFRVTKAEPPAFLNNEGGVILGQIGKLVDDIVHFAETTEPHRVTYHPEEKDYVDIADWGLLVVTVNERGESSWKPVTAVTRHLPGGKLVRVTTRSGRVAVGTKSLSFLTRKNNVLTATLGSDLRVGDYLPVCREMPAVTEGLTTMPGTGWPLKRSLGLAFGAYLADAEGKVKKSSVVLPKSSAINLRFVYDWHAKHESQIGADRVKICSNELARIFKDSCGGNAESKRIPPWALIANTEFVRGLLAGWFLIDHSHFPRRPQASTLLMKGILELSAKINLRLHVVESRFLNQYPIPDDQIPITFSDNCVVVLTINEIKQKLNDPATVPEDQAILRSALDQHVYYDPIVAIDEVDSTHPKVYDLSVADTFNFCGFGTIVYRDTFHNTGISAKDVTLGVPRLKELLNATHKPSKPTAVIHLQTPMALHPITEEAARYPHRTVADFLVESRIKYVVESEVEGSPVGVLEHEPYRPEPWVELATGLGFGPAFPAEGWVVVLKFDVDRLFTHSVTLSQIAERIVEESGGARGPVLTAIASPNVMGQVVVYLNFSEIREVTIEKLEVPTGEEITRTLITPENVEYFTTREVVWDMILKTRVQGIAGITKSYVREDPKTKEWLIDTQGTNLREILGIAGVDTTRTQSDDMWEIYHTFGIEAVRTFLVREITKVLSFDGTYINPRHITLLVDGMTRTGGITSVNRDGIPRDVGPIAKGMFEKPVDNFAHAAAFSEQDRMHGMAASVMYGTLSEAGTGTTEIKDAEKLPVPRRKIMEVLVAKAGRGRAGATRGRK